MEFRLVRDQIEARILEWVNQKEMASNRNDSLEIKE